MAIFTPAHTAGAAGSGVVQAQATPPVPPVGTYAGSLFVRGPVSVLVILQDGRQIGETPSGESVNHLIGEGEMIKQAGTAGTYEWWIFLPETGYRVDIHALDTGALEVAVGGSGFDVPNLRPGELLSFNVAPDGVPGPVTRSGGETVTAASLPVIAAFSCMIVLGLALVIVSGIGLARRGRAR
jgi:hypothetical protein